MYNVEKVKRHKEEQNTMSYRAAKISYDGSHYIATPKENFPQGYRRRRAARPLSVKEAEKKAQFESVYKESRRLPSKSAKPTCGKPWKKLSRIRRNGQNTSSGTLNARELILSAGKFV